MSMRAVQRKWLPASIFRREQRRIAAGRRRVDGDYLFGGKSQKIIRAAGFGAGAGESSAAERLCADHSADHAAVDVDIAVGKPCRDFLHRRIDARMDAQRK